MFIAPPFTQTLKFSMHRFITSNQPTLKVAVLKTSKKKKKELEFI